MIQIQTNQSSAGAVYSVLPLVPDRELSIWPMKRISMTNGKKLGASLRACRYFLALPPATRHSPFATPLWPGKLNLGTFWYPLVPLSYLVIFQNRLAGSPKGSGSGFHLA
jgi:hypothetical protein